MAIELRNAVAEDEMRCIELLVVIQTRSDSYRF